MDKTKIGFFIFFLSAALTCLLLPLAGIFVGQVYYEMTELDGETNLEHDKICSIFEFKWVTLSGNPNRICFCFVFVIRFFCPRRFFFWVSVDTRKSGGASGNRLPHCIHNTLLLSDGIKFDTVGFCGSGERREPFWKCRRLQQWPAFLMTSISQRQGRCDQPIIDPARISMNYTGLIPNRQPPNLCYLRNSRWKLHIRSMQEKKWNWVTCTL